MRVEEGKVGGGGGGGDDLGCKEFGSDVDDLVEGG